MTCICDTRVCISQEFMETWRPELKLFVMIVDNGTMSAKRQILNSWKLVSSAPHCYDG